MAEPNDPHHDLDLTTRISRMASGLGNAASQIPGFFEDVSTALAQDDYDSMLELVKSRAIARGSTALDQAFSDAQGFAALGHGSETLATAGQATESAGESIARGYEWLTGDLRVDPETGERISWTETGPENTERRGLGFQMRRAVSTALTAPQLADSENADFSLLDGDTWNTAHELSGGDFGEDLTIGQSLFFLLSNTDILDESQVANWADSPMFDLATGTVDALVRMTSDPDVLLGRGARGLRHNYLRPNIKHSLSRGHSLDDLLGSRKGRQMDRWINNLPDDLPTATAKIKSRAFPRDMRGWSKSRLLAEAPDTDTRDAIWRVMYGDLRALRDLRSVRETLGKRSELMGELRDLQPVPARKRFFNPGANKAVTDRAAALQSQLEKTVVDESAAFAHLTPSQAADARFAWLNDPERYDLVQGEINDTMRATATMDQLESLFRSEEELVTKGFLGGAIRESIATHSTYQKSPFTKPVRVTHEKRPHRIVDVEDDNISEQFARTLRKTPMDQADVNRRVTDMAAELDPTTRIRMWDDGMEAAMGSIVSKVNRDHGVALSRAESQSILDEARNGLQNARDHVRKQYSAGNRDLISVETPEGIENVRVPLFRSDTPNAVFSPDFPAIERKLSRHAQKGRLPKEGSLVELGTDALDSVNYYWKSHVLLRGAWPMRVTGFDEMWRPLIKYGSAAVPEVAKGARNYTRAVAKDLGFDNPSRAAKVGAATGSMMGLMMGGVPGVTGSSVASAALGAAGGGAAGGLGFRLLSNLAKSERAGINWTRLNKLGIAPPFGEPGDVANLYFDRASSRRQMQQFMNEDRHMDELMEEIQRNPRSFETIRPDDPRHLEDWQSQINGRLRADSLAQRVLRGDDHSDIVSWLGTHEGQRYVRGMRAHDELADADAFVENLTAEAQSLFPGKQGAQLRSIALERPVTSDDLTSLYPDPSSRPSVTGQALASAQGDSVFFRKLHQGIDRWMNRLGSMPTDNLVRNPTFEVSYRRFFEDTLDTNFPHWRNESGPATINLTPEELSSMQDSARRKALADTRDLAYDMAERSDLHHLIRHIHPFAPAVQEAVSTHFNLARSNPLPYVRAAKTWFSADNIDGISWRDPDEGSQWLVFQVPESARNITKHLSGVENAIDNQGMVRVPKNGFNMILQAPFGVGPFVQASVGELLRRKPGTEDDLKPLLDVFMPYGAGKDFLDPWLATWAKRTRAGLEGWLGSEDSNREYRNLRLRNLGMEIAKAEDGLREPIDWDDAEQVAELEETVDTKTNALFALRAVTGFLSPVQPVYESPLWLHEQALRQEQERERAMDPAEKAELHREHGTAIERFADAYGDELVWVLNSFSKSNDGVPPDTASFENAEQFRDLIQEAPESSLGGWVIGRGTNSQQLEYSASVYDYQLREPVAPFSDTTQREPVTGEELHEGGQETLAWRDYTRFMDWLDAERVSRGLPNFSVAEARDLMALKRRREEQIAQQYPAWQESREREITLPQAKWQERIGFFRRALSQEPKLANRPDGEVLSQYLSARDNMVSQLADRASQDGSKTLDSDANLDLQRTWDAFTADLVERNPTFAPVYYRWLEHDKLSADDLGETGGGS